MKKTSFIATFILVVMFIFSCSNDDSVPTTENETGINTTLEEAILAVTIDDIQKDIDLYSNFGEGNLKSAEIIEGDCPVITAEKINQEKDWPRRITIDFGTGCVKNEKEISGKIIIVKTAPWRTAGAVREVSFRDYMIDGVKIEGSKRIANITEKELLPKFSIKADITTTYRNEAGEVVKVIKRKEDKVQVWRFGFKEREVDWGFEVSGTSRVVIIKDSQEKVIEKELKEIALKMGCRFPQSGIINFNIRNTDNTHMKFKIDYSTAKAETGCDSSATIYFNDTSKEIDLAQKWREIVQKK